MALEKLRREKALLVSTVVLLNSASLMIAAFLWVGQKPFDASRFEFGSFRDWTGVIEANPYPQLIMLKPGGGDPTRILLVASGKHGATNLVAGLDHKAVRLRGSLIERDEQRMLEIEGPPVATNAGEVERSAPVPLGASTLRGEIVDSKCYLGVMNPGHGKVHRACAARCISGGIPPMLVSQDAMGRTLYALLTDSTGMALGPDLAAFVGEPVSVSGELFGLGEWLQLRVRPNGIRRN